MNRFKKKHKMYLQFYINGNYDKQRYFEEGWVCTGRASLKMHKSAKY